MAFRYLQWDEKLSPLWMPFWTSVVVGLFGGVLIYFGIQRLFWRESGEWVVWLVFLAILGFGLLILIVAIIEFYETLLEVRKGLVAILQGPISRHWIDSDPEFGKTHNIQVLRQEHTIEEELWNTLKEGDAVCIEQLPRSGELLHIQPIASASENNTVGPSR